LDVAYVQEVSPVINVTLKNAINEKHISFAMKEKKMERNAYQQAVEWDFAIFLWILRKVYICEIRNK